MAYEFRDPNQIGAVDQVGWVTVSFNGTVLEDVPGLGWLTVDVKGRGLIVPDIGLTKRGGSDGSFVEEITIPDREIVVVGQVMAENKLEALRKLNDLLVKHHGWLRFSDTEESYSAILYGVAYDELEVPLMVRLSFICPDPYAYSDEMILFGLVVSQSVTGEQRMDEIEFQLLASGNNFKLTNPRTGKNVVLTGEFTSGQKIVMRWKDELMITLNGQPILNRLSLASDFETFTVTGGDVLTVNISSTSMILMRRRRL